MNRPSWPMVFAIAATWAVLSVHFQSINPFRALLQRMLGYQGLNSAGGLILSFGLMSLTVALLLMYTKLGDWLRPDKRDSRLIYIGLALIVLFFVHTHIPWAGIFYVKAGLAILGWLMLVFVIGNTARRALR